MSKNTWEIWSKNQNSIIKFIVVRHPFERLVSAFRQKIEAWNSITWGSARVKDILKYKQQYLDKFGSASLNKENNYGAILPVKNRNPSFPTFWMFIQWIINDQGWKRNEHFRTYSMACAYCSFEFDYILKLELEQEKVDFMKVTGLDEYIVSDLENRANANRPEEMSR